MKSLAWTACVLIRVEKSELEVFVRGGSRGGIPCWRSLNTHGRSLIALTCSTFDMGLESHDGLGILWWGTRVEAMAVGKLDQLCRRKSKPQRAPRSSDPSVPTCGAVDRKNCFALCWCVHELRAAMNLEVMNLVVGSQATYHVEYRSSQNVHNSGS